MSKLYIAYGSNLHIEQMARRCPTASVYARGVLKDYRLVYRGSKTGSYASVEPCEGSSVPIVVWEIQPEDEERLDRYEGYPTFYYKNTVEVKTGRGILEGMIYIISPKALPGRPSQYYIDVVRTGYIENGFDLDVFNRSLRYNAEECRTLYGQYTTRYRSSRF
ncbi:MAG: gamma-glutamylcyclotransferase [Eubacterium sp.]|nr:gamma-glutamylcyclotransferase [Eubacterium sp.]